VPTRGGFRLACNRDEQRTRPLALPPRVSAVGAVRAVCPTDPQSGGTWIAVNDAGLALTLLNRTDRSAAVAPEPTPARSRGEIIPHLAAATGLTEVYGALRRLSPSLYDGFQLVAVHAREYLVGISDRSVIRFTSGQLDRPLMFTSSALGDRDADRVRRPVFESLVCRSRDPLEGQRHFHDHRWPGCPAFSIRMRRADARTVSRSTVTVDTSGAWLAYEALAER
jgi:uncharacterized protein with NRDE domain